MSEATVRVLTERLDRLERRDRRLALTGVAMLLGVAAVAVMGQAPSTGHTLDAQRFVVTDADGKPRAVLGAAGERWGLMLYDEQGRERAALSLGPDDIARLSFYDRGGRARVSLDVTAEGASSTGFYDGGGKGHAQVQVAADGSPELGFFDKDGKPIWAGKLLLPH